VIEDPMNKVHMGKNKSHVGFDNTKIDFKSILSIPMVCVCVCESARDCIIKRLNFVIKLLNGVTILV